MALCKTTAVSMPPWVAKRARRAAGRDRARRARAYTAAAVEDGAEVAALLDEMLAASGGPLTAEERCAADRLLGICR